MERLTHPRSNGIKTGYRSPNKKDELVERLAEYEDTGLTPQEIYELKARAILKSMGMQWIPVEERLPEADKYVLVSFENFSLPMIGRYTVDDDDSGTFRIGDDDDSFVQYDLFVNAWMYPPEPYGERNK